MKIPTKEQIEKIARKLIKERVKLLKSCGFSDEEIRNRIHVSDVQDFVSDGITEWEKIRPGGKRNGNVS